MVDYRFVLMVVVLAAFLVAVVSFLSVPTDSAYACLIDQSAPDEGQCETAPSAGPPEGPSTASHNQSNRIDAVIEDALTPDNISDPKDPGTYGGNGSSSASWSYCPDGYFDLVSFQCIL